MAKATDVDVRRKRGVSPIAGLFGVALSGVFWLVISLILSVLVEWVGMFTLWSDEGSNHSIRMFTVELAYANDVIANHLASDSVREEISTWMSSLDSSGVTAYNNVTAWKDSAIVRYMNAQAWIESLFVSAFFIAKIFLLRLFTLMFSLPVFFLAAWLACVDGLVERELRKAGNDRESNVIFDFAVSYSYWVLMVIAILYLASPFPSNPMYFFLPGAAIFFFFVRTSFAMYKKYV